MSFLKYLKERIIKYGNSGGGLGWLIYWMLGLGAVCIFELVNYSDFIYISTYFVLTVIYIIILVIKNIKEDYARWKKEK